MLGIAARRIDGRTAEDGYGPSGVQVFDAPPPTSAHAFSWGGLTSGSPIRALWLVLLPFVLVNAAGWTLVHDPHHGVSERVRVLVLRVAALASTVLTVQLAMIALLDVVGLQWLHGLAGPPSAWPNWLRWLDVLDRGPGPAVEPGAVLWARVGITATLGLLVLLWYLTRVRTPSSPGTHPALGSWNGGASRFADLALRCRIDDPADPMWSQAGLIQRLRTLHIAAALGALTFTAGMVADGGPWLALQRTVIPATAWWEPFVVDLQLTGDPVLLLTGAVLVAAALVLLVVRSLGGEAERARWRSATRLVGWLGIPSGVAAMVLVAPRTTQAMGSLRIAATITGVLVAGLAFALGLAEVLTRWRRGVRPRRGGLVAPGLVLLGLAVIGAAGSSSEMLLANWGGGGGCLDTGVQALSGCPAIGVGAFALAVTYAAGLLVLIATAAVWFLVVGRSRVGNGRWWTPPPPERDTGDENMKVLRRMLDRPATWFAWMLGFAVAGMVTAVVVLARGGTGLLDDLADVGAPAPVLLDLVAWSVPAVLLVWVVALTLRPWQRLAAVAGLALVVVWNVHADHGFSIAGVPVVPVGSRQVVLWLGLIGPVVTILLRARTGLSDPAARRQLGILWDLGLFWPRWFHPFTPPTYGDLAVTEFRNQVQERIDGSADTLVVSAHSQGSVIAVAALATMPPAQLQHVALVTYGSPVGRLYGELFGATIDGALLQGLREDLTGPTGVRWRNLHRVTDPIGGPIVAPHQTWLHDTPTSGAAPWAPVESPPGGLLPDPRHMAHSGYQFTAAYADVVADLVAQLDMPPGAAGH